MGVKITIHTIPKFDDPREILEPGWIRREPNVCPRILESLVALGEFAPLARPFWLQDKLTKGWLKNEAGTQEVKTEPAATTHSRDGEDTNVEKGCTAKGSRKFLTVSCPGLRATSLPDKKGVIPADLSVTNPEGLTAYGPTAKLEEKFYKEYRMPLYPTPTVHGLKLVFSTARSLDIWQILGHENTSMTTVIPLPSWWHLPSDAVTSALGLILALFGSNPVNSIQELVHSRVEVRQPPVESDDTAVEIYGFSAGSYSGMLAYRLLVEKGHALGCSFHHGALGGVTFHPEEWDEVHNSLG
jgi:hypothetical protein